MPELYQYPTHIETFDRYLTNLQKLRDDLTRACAGERPELATLQAARDVIEALLFEELAEPATLPDGIRYYPRKEHPR